MKALVTGGLGYIGSHTVVELLNKGMDVVVLDNLENSSATVLDVIERLTSKRPEFDESDVRSKTALDEVFKKYKPDIVVHFAAKKDPQASIAESLSYYETNVCGTMNILASMAAYDVKRLVFSSSAAVYGNPTKMPISEDMRTDSLTPYARSKEFSEQIIRDHFSLGDRGGACILRYFNPTGTHPSGLFAPHHHHDASNLFPSLVRAARFDGDPLIVYGNDLPTKDGTGIRDYIHVQDLAIGHVAAISHAEALDSADTINLGTGVGYSVKEVIQTCEHSLECKVPFSYGPARKGDPVESYADTSKAGKLLKWRPEKDLKDMLRDEWIAYSVPKNNLNILP